MDTVIGQSYKPIVPSLADLEVAIPSSDPEVRPLIALIGTTPEKYVLSRFTPTPEQREAIARGSDLFICIQTNGHPVQPILLFTSEDDEVDPANVVEFMQLVP
ncbi:MAG: hypothetical protein ACREJN_08085 [Nitrospiraceae bacterium]